VPFGPARNETPRPSLPAPVQSLPDPNGAAPYLIADPASPSTAMMYRGIQAKPVFRAPLARCKGPPSSSVCRWTGPPPRPPRAARFLTDPSVSAPVQRLDFQRAQGALPLRKLAAPFQDEPSPGQSFQGPVPRLSVGGLDGSIWVRDHDAHRYAPPPAAARPPDGTWRPDEVRGFRRGERSLLLRGRQLGPPPSQRMEKCHEQPAVPHRPQSQPDPDQQVTTSLR
jgi:hypothetical protein